MKNRFYKAPLAFRASRLEWLDELRKPGCEGGLLAEEGVFEEMVENHEQTNAPFRRQLCDAESQDWEAARKNARITGKTLRGVSAGSLVQNGRAPRSFLS